MYQCEVKNNKLIMDGIFLEDLVKEYGSPLYVYDGNLIRQKYRTLRDAITYDKKRLHYAMKANSNIRILQILMQEDSFIDAVSLEEAQIAIEAGFEPQRILCTAVNLTTDEMKLAMQKKIRLNVGSLHTLMKYGELYRDSEVSIRINPDTGAGHHDHCITGGKESKFGIFESDIPKVKEILKKYNLKLVGVHSHIGSGILDVDKYMEVMEIILRIAKNFEALEFIDFGGGFGIAYSPDENDFDLQAFGKRVSERMERFASEYGSRPVLAIEPGRYPVAESGIFLVTVTDIKDTPKYHFIGVDSGFNHLIRPMAYGSYHHIVNAVKVTGKEKKVAIAGYICESGDVFTRNEKGIVPRSITEPEEGDILAIMTAGAYGYAMSQNYNSRPRPAEVLVMDGLAQLIRRRENIADILRAQL